MARHQESTESARPRVHQKKHNSRSLVLQCGAIAVAGLVFWLCYRLSEPHTWAAPAPDVDVVSLRQFADLTAADFAAHPVWVQCHVVDYDEPWYDETDEETFRPWLGPLPVDPAEAMFLVRASLVLADGTRMSGFLTPQAPELSGSEPDLGIIQPQLFVPSGRRVQFWYGLIEPSTEQLLAFYGALGREADNVFPISFSTGPGMTTGVASGSIPGLCSIGTGSVRVSR